MKSRTRQGRIEATERSNRIKAQLDRLKRHKNFLPDFAPWTPGGNPCGFLSWTRLGIEVRLRFSQDACEWQATCPHFDIKIAFADQDADQIQTILNDWLRPYIERPASPDARLRSNRPAVAKLAKQYDINPSLALEVYEERGF